MWHTEAGDRILKGAEAKVFATSLYDLVYQVKDGRESDYPIEFGINVFDNLTHNQQISILWLITNYLFRKNMPLIKLTALNEGAVAAVFKNLREQVTLEIEELPKSKFWRRLIKNALAELDYEDKPFLKCNDINKWNMAIDFLSELILWDSDYEMDNITDNPPEKSKFIKYFADINDDYFDDIADDPDDSIAEKRITQIKKILNKVLK
jgi:hypothetical protein